MVDLLYHLVILVLYYYINLRSSVTFFLSFGDIYLSLSIFSPFITELFYGEIFETLAVLSAILFPVNLPVVSAVF